MPMIHVHGSLDGRVNLDHEAALCSGFVLVEGSILETEALRDDAEEAVEDLILMFVAFMIEDDRYAYLFHATSSVQNLIYSVCYELGRM